MKNRQPFLTHCFALVICRHTDGYVSKETKNRGWWVAGGLVDPGEEFYTAAIRETKEEAGITIELKGILRVEYSVCGTQTARMRVIFFATSNDLQPKQISDSESELASWLTINEIIELGKTKPGLRGPEILDWPKYIENGGVIAPLSFLVDELDEIKMNDVIIYNKTNNNNKNLVNVNNDSNKLFLDSLVNEDEKMIKELLIKGVDPNTKINQKNWTALHYAIKTQNEPLVKILLLNDARVENITHKDRNCLHFAVQSKFKILKLLIIAISDLNEDDQLGIINHQDAFGDTPLHVIAKDISSQIVDKEIFNFLLNYGADPNIKNNEGLSPYDIINIK